MKVFNIDNACAGYGLKLEEESGYDSIFNSEKWYCITSDYGLVSFQIGAEVVFASGRYGKVVFDEVEIVDVENQTVILKEFGIIRLHQWEFFARV